jgi:hypothetical protein
MVGIVVTGIATLTGSLSAGIIAATAITTIGATAALGALQIALTPRQVIKSRGARLTESQITSSTEGAPISRLFGTSRVGGQLIWTTTFLEKVRKKSEGGEKGTPEIKSTTYTYSASFAVAFCKGAAGATLNALWVDGQRVDLDEVTYRFYDGADDQEPDPKIEAVEGAGTVSAWRGVCYIVFEDQALAQFGNRIPQITAEVTIPGADTLDAVIETLCVEAGYDSTDVDVTILANETDFGGVYATPLESPRGLIENLLRTFHCDAVEAGAGIKFISRKSVDTIAVELDDLIINEEGDSYGRQIVRADSIAKRTKIDYVDATRSYQAASVDGYAANGKSQSVNLFETRALIDTAYARNLADALTQESMVARNMLKFTLPFGSPITLNEYLSAAPGVVFTLLGRQYRIISRTLGDEIEIEAQGYSSDVYQTLTHASSSTLSYEPLVYGQSTAIFAELPVLSASEPALWSPRIAAQQSPWPGSVLFYRDDVLNTQATFPATIGVTNSTLGYGQPWVWDRTNTVNVVITTPGRSLSSATEDAVLNGANALAVQTPSGEWEVLQFQTATLEADGTYTLSDLLRGQLGTEPYIGDPTPAGAQMILYDASEWATFDGTAGLIGVDLAIDYGPGVSELESDNFQATTVTPRGVAYRPYAPSNLSQIKQSGGDISLEWVRRTRFDGDSWETEEPPLNEDFERYRVKILDGVTIVREWDVSDATTVTYSLADQTTDFGGGQSTVSWCVQQISAIYGPGSTGEDS